MAGTLNYDLRLNATQAERELSKFQDKLSGVNDLFGKLRNTVATLGLASFITNAIQAAAALDDIANSSGIALQNVIGFSKAVKDFGGSAEGAATGIARFSNFIQEAAGGNKKAQDTIYELGMSLDELRKTSDADLLKRTIQGLAEMDDKTKALSIGMSIFGKSFAGVSYKEVNANIDQYIARAVRATEATQAAAAADEKFGQAISALSTAILQIISPITNLLAALKPEQIQFFADAVIKLGAAFLLLKAVNIVIPLLTAFTATVLTARGAVAGLLTTLGVTAAWQSAKTGVYLLQAAVIGLGNSFTVATGGLRMFSGALLAGLAGFVRFIPIVGQVAAVLMIFNDLVDMLTGKSLVGWADEAGAALSKLLGIQYKTEEEKTKAIETEKKLTEQKEASAKAAREVADALQKEKDALQNNLKLYQLANEEANKRFKFETNAISMSEKAKMIGEQKLDAETKYNQELLKLQTQLDEKKKSGSESDKKLIPEIQAAMGSLTKAYNEQVASVGGLVNARIGETRANELRLFQTREMIAADQKLKDLQLEIANTGLPQLIQQYNNLDAAAKKTAESAIASEEARRKEKLSPDEVKSYYDAAKKGVDDLKKATDELAKAQEAYNLKQFGIKERIQLENDLQKIMNDTAKLTMSELQKKEYDILQSAKARAKAEIEAAEARKGSRLSAAEAQVYYDTAIAGTEELIAKQREAYFASRTFASGWRKALSDFTDDATNAAKQAEQIFQKVTSGMEDMIVNFAKTGKFEFKGFINSILEDLLRSQVRQLMAQIFNIGGRQGGSGSGLFGSIGNLLGFANGGIIPTNAPVLVGERGPELISGAAGRNVTPNEQLGLGTTNVVYNINAVDALSFKQMVASDPGFIYAVTQQGARGVPATRR